ncbi:hypothetical protein [Kitasatospora kazusensis]|uniref:hypothetical protein n=1 Tax=Kitasatospora kazusensis TaxID=407974 RepID=UPI0031CF6881
MPAPDRTAAAYGYRPQPPVRSRRRLRIALGSAGAVLLLGGGLLGYFVFGTASDTDTHKVVLPDTFQGVQRDSGNPLAQQLGSSVQEQFDKGGHAGRPTAVSAVYADKKAGKAVAVFGGYGAVLAPSTQVDAFFTTFEQGPGGQGSTFAGRRSFPAGPLGGTLSCEAMKAATETDSLCVWGDGSSVIAVLAGQAGSTATPDLAQAAATALELRQAAELAR